jgi:hypothetical protein
MDENIEIENNSKSARLGKSGFSEILIFEIISVSLIFLYVKSVYVNN